LSDNDFSGSRHRHQHHLKHFWTGGLETAGPGCYDPAAIARAAGFRMLVMCRIRHAAILLEAGQKERPKYPEKSLSDNRS
jgi:hypothetical protein